MTNLNSRNLRGGLIVAVAAVALSACTMKMGIRAPNVNYVYPNSNVTPLGHVKAKSRTSVTIFMAKMFDGKMIDEALAEAAKQKGGDVLINAKIVTKATIIPLFLPIIINSLEVEGTAAKMQVGKQELR